MMKRNFRNNNNGGGEGGQGGQSGGGQRYNNRGQGGNRGNYRKHNNNGGGNQNHHDMGMIGDQEVVHPKQRRHLQAQKDRYVAMARDALQRGDRIQAEFFYQHVEHFSRMINLIPVPQQPQRQHHDANQATSEHEQNLNHENAPANEQDAGEAEELAPIAIGHGPSSFYHQPAAPVAAPAPVVYDTDEER